MNLRPVQVFMNLFLLIFFHLIAVEGRPTDLSIAPRGYKADDPSLPPAVRSICPGGVNATSVEKSEPFGTDGVIITTGVCTPPETSSTNVTMPEVAARAPSCPTAPNDCVSRFGSQFQGNGWVSKCGASCTSTCYQGTGGPDPNHCQLIFNNLWRNQPALFTLEPNNFLLLTYQTCGTGIQNQIAASSVGCSQKMIYDYPDWAAIGGYLAWNCQAWQNARGGRCVGDSGLYQRNIPDYYVQVYRN